MSIETTVGKITNDLNEVIKARIASNLVEVVRKENIQLQDDQLKLVVTAAQAAVSQVGLNAVSTISRAVDKEIESSKKLKSTKGKRKR